jgi:hypothetical protein
MKLSRLTSLFSLKGTSGAGGQLPPPEVPKVKPKQTGFPGHVTRTVAGTAALPKNDPNYANRDLVQEARFAASTSDVLRTLFRANPDMSAALSAHLRMGLPEKYIVYARDPDGSFNVDATRLLLELARRLDTMPGYDAGFNPAGTLRSTAEALGKEIVIEGAMCMELVLDSSRLPRMFAPIAARQIKFYDDWKDGTKTVKPVQDVGGEEIDLDIPNFFMTWLDPSLIDVYPQAPMESAVQPTLASQKFLNDLRRLCERHVYPRYDVTIDLEKLKPHIPAETLLDEQKLAAFLNTVFQQVQDTVNQLGVDEALVHYDFATISFIEGQDGDVPNTFDTVKDIYNGKIATATRSTPTILGHGSGTANVASTETLIAMLTSNSMVRIKVQEIFSKAFTLAANLFGHQVTAHFEFDEIELRPSSEVEAFKSLRQDRLLRQVSLGYMTDEEACLRLTGNLPPTGFTPHFNTMFMDPVSGVEAGDNNYSGTGAGGGQSGGGAASQSRKSSAPTAKRGAPK